MQKAAKRPSSDTLLRDFLAKYKNPPQMKQGCGHYS
jgi:hypothetical protein